MGIAFLISTGLGVLRMPFSSWVTGQQRLYTLSFGDHSQSSKLLPRLHFAAMGFHLALWPVGGCSFQVRYES